MSPIARQHKRRRRELELAGGVRAPGRNGVSNRDRAGLLFLASFYAWEARRPNTPMGNDPRSGQPWPKWGQLARAIAAAENAAAARVCFAAARTYPNPLEEV